MQKLLKNNIKILQNICIELQIKEMYAFGSVVTNDFREDSDIDFLIDFSKKFSINEYSDNYFALQYRLRDLFNRDIDIVTKPTLSNPYFIESIEESKQLIYEA